MKPSKKDEKYVYTYTLQPDSGARPTVCEICNKVLVTDTERRRASEVRAFCDRCIHKMVVVACMEKYDYIKTTLSQAPLEEYQKPLACEFLSLREEIFGSIAVLLADGSCPKTRRYNQLLFYFYPELTKPKDWFSPIAGNVYRREATVEGSHGVYFARSYDAANQDYDCYSITRDDKERFNLRIGDGITILYDKIVISPQEERRDIIPCTIEKKLC